MDESTNSIIFIETKWKNKKVDLGVLRELQKKSTKVEWGKQKDCQEYFGLISKSGFSQELIEISKIDPNLFLIEENRLL